MSYGEYSKVKDIRLKLISVLLQLHHGSLTGNVVEVLEKILT